MTFPAVRVVLTIVTGGLTGVALSAEPSTRPAAAPGAGRSAEVAPPTRPGTQPATAPATKPTVPLEKITDRPLTTDELHQLRAEGKDVDCLRQLLRVLQLRAPAADVYDRYELLMLRGDLHLRLKALQPAVDAFAEAADVPQIRKDEAALARATVALLKRVRNFAYTPTAVARGSKPSPIDVIDRTSRRAALQALFRDEMAAAKPKIDAAMDGKSLAAIAAALDAIRAMADLEVATAGGDAESKQAMADLRDRGLALMARATQRMQARLEDLARRADEIRANEVTVAVPGGGYRKEYRNSRRGLEAAGRTEVKAILETAKQIGPHAEGLAEATGGDPRHVGDLVTAAQTLARRAEQVLQSEEAR